MKKLVLLFLLIPLIVFAQSPIGANIQINQSIIIPSGLGALTDANPYDILIIEDPTGTPAVVQTLDFNYNSGAGNTVSLTSNLDYSKDYSWAVLTDGYTWSGYANYQSDALYGEYLFSTIDPLVAATNLAPNGLNGQSLTPTLTWDAATDGTSPYSYVVKIYNNVPALIHTSASQAGTSYVVPGAVLSYNSSYTWKVETTDNSSPVQTETSVTASFTTMTSTPTLVSPANNSYGLTLTGITLTWNAVTGATHYRVTVSPNPGSSPYTVVAPAVSQTLPTLTAGTFYTWYVEASNDGGTTWSTPSNTWNFITNFLTSVANPTQTNYAVGISVLPTFTWAPAMGASGYQLELSTDNSTWTVYTGATSPYTFTNFNQLLSGTLYYWRVRANDVGGVGVHRYSSTWEFTTVNGNLNITTYYPYGTSANLAWLLLPYTANVKYDLYYSDDGFTTFTTVPNLTNTFYTLTGLSPATTYDVIVRAKNNAGTVIIAYSASVSFTTDGLPTPYLSYPIGGATTYSNPPYLYWYTGTLFSGQYQVRYATNSSVDGSGMLNHGSAANLALTSNLFTVFPAALTPGQTYYWQVRCYDGVTYGPWSAVESFVVYSSTPTVAPVPYPSWPVGGNNSYINPPTLYWYTGTFTTGLYFQVNVTGPGGYNHTSSWIASNLYYTLPAALVPGTYTWKVKSTLDTLGTPSAWSSTTTFVIPATSSTVNVPYPTAPVGTIVSTLNPTMSWFAITPPALEYRIRISPYSNVDSNGMLNHPTAQSSGWTTSTSIAYNSLPSAPSALIPGVTYYWQVQAKLANSPYTESSWSYVVSFETAAGATAIIPLVVSPIQGQPINSTSAILTWALPGKPQTHLKYDVEYSKNADFSNAVRISGLNEPVTKIDGLDKNSKYYWRVISKNNSGSQSMYSSVGSFSTGNVTSVESEHQVIPANFELAQNYPNPFNPTTSITYSIPKDNFVTIKVYDMLGREVATLVNDYKNAGNHTVKWNGEDNYGQKVASGTYIYRITADSFVATKKMVLLK